jgi:hypothetical protein
MALYHLSQIRFPWYNTTAIAWEMVAVALALEAIHTPYPRRQRGLALCSGVLAAMSFWTKQDYGALTLAGVGVLTGVGAWRGCRERRAGRRLQHAR